MTLWTTVSYLMQRAKAELLASDLRKSWEGEGATPQEIDQDFLYQLWTAHLDKEVWEASRSLGAALVAWVQYKADDILGNFQTILDNVDGHNHLIIADMDDFDSECWEEWKEKIPA